MTCRASQRCIVYLLEGSPEALIEVRGRRHHHDVQANQTHGHCLGLVRQQRKGSVKAGWCCVGLLGAEHFPGRLDFNGIRWQHNPGVLRIGVLLIGLVQRVGGDVVELRLIHRHFVINSLPVLVDQHATTGLLGFVQGGAFGG